MAAFSYLGKIRSVIMSDYPMAIPAPDAGLNEINGELLASINAASRASPRKRIIMPFHHTAGDPLQRMLNSLQPGTYIRPHRHAAARAESLIVLSGSILYIDFTEEGRIRNRIKLSAGSDRLGIDTAGGLFHSFIALEPDTVLFEVKPGPYDPSTDKEFARWAPAEYTPEAEAYLQSLLSDSI
jgi:cupin fold WbuC family metalloprotein